MYNHWLQERPAMQRKDKATLADVARLAGVSTATVTGWFGQVYEPVYTVSGGE